MSAYYSEWSSMGDKFSDVGNAIRDFLTGVEDSIEGTVKGLLTLVADLGILYVYSECTQTVSGYVPEVLDQEVEKIKQKYEPLLKDPVNTIGGIGQSICDTADEKGVAYSSGYIVAEVVTALLADKGLDKIKNVAKTGKTADNVADIAEGAAKGAGNAAEDAGKAGKGLEEATKGAESAAEDAGKVVESGSKTGAGEYVAPGGGGGVTSTIKVNGRTVNFGHGGRHLEGTGLSVDTVNQALANEVSVLNLGTGQFHKGQIIVDGITIEYTSYGVSEGIINVGTYYPLQ